MSAFGIGIDLGGTLIKGAAFDLASGDLLHEDVAPARDGEWEGGDPAFLFEIRQLLQRFEGRESRECSVVGVSSPGFANREASHIVSMPGRLEGLEGLEWPEALRRPAAVLNDAHAALMGEIWQGAASGVEDVILLTLGTGVGGAIVTEGRLLRGHFGKGGHLGHASLDLHGETDICGMPGALEDMIGNHNVRERSDGRYESTRELVDAVRGGDQHALEVWGRSEEFEWRPGGGQVEIRRAALGPMAGAYGAAYFAMRRYET